MSRFMEHLVALSRPVARGVKKLPDLINGGDAPLKPQLRTPPFVPEGVDRSQVLAGHGGTFGSRGAADLAHAAPQLRPPVINPPVARPDDSSPLAPLNPARLYGEGVKPPALSRPDSSAPATRPRLAAPAPVAVGVPEEMQAPGAGRPRFADTLRQGQYEFVFGSDGAKLARPDKKTRFLEGLKTALAGAAQGYATTGTPGGALGGLIAGGAGGAINPTAGREVQFDVFQRPRLREEALWREAREKARLGSDLERARINTEQAQGRNYDDLARHRASQEERQARLDEMNLGLQRLEQERRELQNELARATNPLRVQEIQARIRQIEAQAQNALASAKKHGAQSASGSGLTPYQEETLRRKDEEAFRKRQSQARDAREAFELSKRNADALGKQHRQAVAAGDEQAAREAAEAYNSAFDEQRRLGREFAQQFGDVFEVREENGWFAFSPRAYQPGGVNRPGAAPPQGEVNLDDARAKLRQLGHSDEEIDEEFRRRGYVNRSAAPRRVSDLARLLDPPGVRKVLSADELKHIADTKFGGDTSKAREWVGQHGYTVRGAAERRPGSALKW
jgi:hypothetical protein